MADHPLLIVEASLDDADVLIGRLTLLGAEGIEQRDGTTLHKAGAEGLTLMAGFDSWDSAREAYEALKDEYAVKLETLHGDAWRDAWKEHWRPMRITDRVVVVPSWIEYSPEPGDMVMKLDPGRAFGTGQHPTTTLVARALERILAGADKPSIIDLGCGSGILSFCALMFGAPRAIACDIDADSVAAAQENAVGLGLADRIELRAGSIAVVPETSTLVVANIEAAVLVPLCSEVVARVAPGGRLVLSGILAEQRDMVETAYRAAGMTPDGCASEGGWIAPEFVRAP